MVQDRLTTAARLAHLELREDLIQDCEAILQFFAVLQEVEPEPLRRKSVAVMTLTDEERTATPVTLFKGPRTAI